MLGELKVYFYYETDGNGKTSTSVRSFQASTLTMAKLYATRRSSRRYTYIVLGDQIDPDTMEITNIVAVRHKRRGWRECFGKENPYAL